jgi:hypothetical protein
MKDLEERVCVKFCLKLRKTATKTWKILQQAFSEECMSRTQCFEWYSHFKTERTSIDEYPLSRRPSTSIDNVHIDAVLHLILQNRHLPIRETTEDIGISFGSCQAILTEAVCCKRPQLWMNHSWVLHHDNAPAHSSFLVRNFLAKNETNGVPQPP